MDEGFVTAADLIGEAASAANTREWKTGLLARKRAKYNQGRSKRAKAEASNNSGFEECAECHWIGETVRLNQEGDNSSSARLQ